jgi:hypothetical protein
MSEPPPAAATLTGGNERCRHRRSQCLLLLIQAVIMVGAGLLALVYPLLTTTAAALFLGCDLSRDQGGAALESSGGKLGDERQRGARKRPKRCRFASLASMPPYSFARCRRSPC